MATVTDSVVGRHFGTGACGWLEGTGRTVETQLEQAKQCIATRRGGARRGGGGASFPPCHCPPPNRGPPPPPLSQLSPLGVVGISGGKKFVNKNFIQGITKQGGGVDPDNDGQ